MADETFETDEDFRHAVNRQFERREASHIPVRLEVAGEEYDATLEDISKSGLRIQCDADIPTRGSVTVHVPYQGEEGKEMHLTGVMRWSKTVTQAGIELTSKTKDV
ncbi:MAG: PilZ domain-containing protein [bacterium]